MGYGKEIVLYKTNEFKDFSALDFIDSLHSSTWKPTLELLDCGENFDWIQLENDEDGIVKFNKILKAKTLKKEYISFRMRDQLSGRFVTVNVFYNEINLSLEIGRDENENHWFDWYHKYLLDRAENLLDKMSRIEFRTGYDNYVIKQIINQCK